MSTAQTYLGTLEALVILGGTYDQPIHDISFDGFNFVRQLSHRCARRANHVYSNTPPG
jgi:hypothetical protein